MSTIDDLAAHLQRFFADRFPLDRDDGPGSVLLLFDSLGTPLQAAEFVGSGTGAAQDILAHQRAAQLADQLPAGNAIEQGRYLPRAGSRLSRWYSELVEGSTAVGPVEDRPFFEAAKTRARKAFDHNRLVLVSGGGVAGAAGTPDAVGTNDAYYATSMSPVDWYTDAATSWTRYELRAGDEAEPPPAVLPRPHFDFRIAATVDADVADFIAVAVADELDPEIFRPPPLFVEVGPPVVGPEPERVGPGIVITGRDLVTLESESLSTTSEVARLATVARFDPGRLLDLELVGSDPGGHGESLMTLRETDLGGANLGLHWLQDHVLQDLVVQPEGDVPLLDRVLIEPDRVLAATTPQNATSSGFHVTFDYTLVRFDRPWWDEVFLTRRGWRVPGYQRGDISSGSALTPSGPLTLVTVGMVVIRALSITANWSDADLAALPTSTSLGPFCIAGAGFDRNNGQLTRNGMQAIAWLVQVPPVVPPITEEN